MDKNKTDSEDRERQELLRMLLVKEATDGVEIDGQDDEFEDQDYYDGLLYTMDEE